MTQTQTWKHHVTMWLITLSPLLYVRTHTYNSTTHTPEHLRIKLVQITRANSWLKLQTLRLVGIMPWHSNFISTDKFLSPF